MPTTERRALVPDGEGRFRCRRCRASSMTAAARKANYSKNGCIHTQITHAYASACGRARRPKQMLMLLRTKDANFGSSFHRERACERARGVEDFCFFFVLARRIQHYSRVLCLGEGLRFWQRAVYICRCADGLGHLRIVLDNYYASSAIIRIYSGGGYCFHSADARLNLWKWSGSDPLTEW